MLTLETSRFVPLRTSFLHRARQAGRDDLDQPVVRARATGGEPLRDLLRRARPGEAILLASYGPFDRPGPFREFGPVYVSEAGGTPEVEWLFRRRDDPSLDYFAGQLTLRAYDLNGHIADAALIEFPAAPDQMQRFLDRPEIAWVDARFPVYGCFAARFVRPPAGKDPLPGRSS